MGVRVGYVYSLSCPIGGDVRYIGQTGNPKERFRKHILSSNYQKPNNRRLAEWIQSVVQQGLTPVFTILAESTCSRQISDLEQYFIDFYLPSGRLLNNDRLRVLHKEIDPEKLKSICKAKKIRYKTISEKLNLHYSTVAGYLSGCKNLLTLEKARLIRDCILSF